MRTTRTMGVAALVLGLLATAALAADASGTWKWTVTGGRNNQAREMTLKLTQEGDKLTGTVTGGRNNTETAIENGKIEGEKVSFTITRTFNNNKMVIKYEGTLSGDTIKGKSGVEGGQRPARDWEAKRAK